jgi:thiamine biosynthesis lipoprotein
MDTTADADWRAWGCDVRVVTGTRGALEQAVSIAHQLIDEVDAACSRFRADSELSQIGTRLATGAEVSPLLAHLIGAARQAADWTDGDVDPTLGSALVELGYDRDFSDLAPAMDAVDEDVHDTSAASGILTRTHRPAWREIRVHGSAVQTPPGVTLDLGASAKAVTADWAAARAAEACGCGVLVSLGGDIATAGDESDGWEILVRDLETDPAQQVHLSPGSAMATSSTQRRRWRAGGVVRHHILDPRTLLPAEPHWRSVSVSAPSCLRANALSTAAIVRGAAAPGWLRSLNVSARLVDATGRVVTTGEWPDPEAVAAQGVPS